MSKIKLETTWWEIDDPLLCPDKYGFQAYNEKNQVIHKSEYDWTMLSAAKGAAIHWAETNGHEILNEDDIRLYGVCLALENEKA